MATTNLNTAAVKARLDKGIAELAADLAEMQCEIDRAACIAGPDAGGVTVTLELWKAWANDMRASLNRGAKLAEDLVWAEERAEAEAAAEAQDALDFDAHLQAWLDAVNEMLEAHRAERFPNLPAEPAEASKGGRKYVRILKGGSAYAFVCRETGDVLKPAGWKGPAKHARGNIYRRSEGLGVGPYGANYCR